MSTTTVFPIASGLPSVALQEFDTSAWFHATGNSIYLKFLPQDMSKEVIRAALEFAGQINRIDIVNSPPNNMTGATYRMAFIHFDFWYSTQYSMDFRGQIVSAYPRPFKMFSSVLNRELTVTINTRPVPKTDYNVDQLSDMFHRLQEQFTTTISDQAKQVADQSKQVADQSKQIAEQAKQIQDLTDEVAYLKKIGENNIRDYCDLKLSVDDLEEQVEVIDSNIKCLNEVSNKEIARLVNGGEEEDPIMEFRIQISDLHALISNYSSEMERHDVDLAFEDARINNRVKYLSECIGMVESSVHINTQKAIYFSTDIKELFKQLAVQKKDIQYLQKTSCSADAVESRMALRTIKHIDSWLRSPQLLTYDEHFDKEEKHLLDSVVTDA